jgi:hypothetical protein
MGQDPKPTMVSSDPGLRWTARGSPCAASGGRLRPSCGLVMALAPTDGGENGTAAASCSCISAVAAASAKLGKPPTPPGGDPGGVTGA